MMKKLLLLALAVPTVGLATELSPGTWQLTGGTTLGYSSTSTKIEGSKATDNSFGVETSCAYYLTPTLGLGLELSYNNTSSTAFDGTKSDQNAYFVGPKLALDLPVAPQIAIFGDVALGVAKGDIDGVTLDGWGFGLAGGVKYFFTRSVSADVGLQYRLLKVDGTFNGTTVSADSSDFRIGLALSVYLGNAAGH